MSNYLWIHLYGTTDDRRAAARAMHDRPGECRRVLEDIVFAAMTQRDAR